jgi:tRNA-splicing ligase RtcB
MFTCQIGNVPLKLWMSEQEFYSDAELQKQASAVSNHPFVFHHVSVMADGHPGFGMPIGGVAAFKGAVCPYGVGSDIGCGMAFVRTNIDASLIRGHDIRDKIKARVKAVIPMGFEHHYDDKHLKGYASTLQVVTGGIPDEIAEIMSKAQVLASAGTLGSGNHFLEFQEDETGRLCVMLHSGSRNIGAQVCKIHHAVAMDYCAKEGIAIPCKELAVLPVTSAEGMRYLNAMNYCLLFARDSRNLMMHNLLDILRVFFKKVEVDEDVHIHHNYAAPEDHFGEVSVYVHRKGATDASLGRKGVIPGSMGTASYIVEGLGNPESFHSCSHGSGRKMSRGAAKRSITMKDFETAMGDVVYDHATSLLDESPGAYKSIETVMANQTDLVRIVHTLKPLVAIKSVGCKED